MTLPLAPQDLDLSQFEELAAHLRGMRAKGSEQQEASNAIEHLLAEVIRLRAEVAKDARDAARYRWWRLNNECLEEDVGGLPGVAFDCQMPLGMIDGPRELLFDAIADFELEQAALAAPLPSTAASEAAGAGDTR